MKDFPVFTTEYGVASLVLREIPYQQTAYIILRDSLEPEKLTEQCADFCRTCGAEYIYASGHDCLARRPFHTAVWRMRCPMASLPDTDAALWPVQAQTLDTWLEIYRKKVRGIPNGAWMTQADGEAMVKQGNGYFIHRGDTLLGIGRAAVDTIDFVASVYPGAGRDIVLSLAHALTEETAQLTVASANRPAVALYESLHFIRAEEISRWYRLRPRDGYM